MSKLRKCGKILGEPVNGYNKRCGQLWMGELVYCEKCEKANTREGEGAMNKEELQEHIKLNLGDDPYSPMVVIAALYKKLYGELPKIGMSGFQADAANSIELP